MKNFKIAEMFHGLSAMDGRARVVDQNNQKVLGPVEPYSFDAETQLAFIVNKNRLREHFEAIAELEQKEINAANAKVIALSKDETLEKDERENKKQIINLELAEKLSDIRNKETKVKLHKVNISKLKLDENRIPMSDVERIFPMLKYEALPPAED